MIGDRVTFIGFPPHGVMPGRRRRSRCVGAIARRIQQHEKNLMVLLKKIFGETK